MKTPELLRIRLHNQLLAGNNFTTPREIVSWMGAIQSQNYEMAKWGVGVRLPGSTNKIVEAAINRGEIIRTHILRPTWHFVDANDIHWMLKLTSPRIKQAFHGYARTLNYDIKEILQGCDRLSKILEKHGHLTRQEIGEHLIAEGFPINDPHKVTYIAALAELDGIICSGEVRGNKQTYALLHHRSDKSVQFSTEEALAELAKRYFNSHGPATLADYAWWSGLSMTEAKKGLEAVKHLFISEEINGNIYWMRSDLQSPPSEERSALLLPAFDEYVVSYKERAEIISEKYYRKVLTINGIFSPTIHLNGEIIGSWKRVKQKKTITAELSFFETAPKKVQPWFNQAIKGYEEFYR